MVDCLENNKDNRLRFEQQVWQRSSAFLRVECEAWHESVEWISQESSSSDKYKNSNGQL